MKTVPLEDPTLTVSRLLETARGGDVVLTLGGRPVWSISVRDLAEPDGSRLAADPGFLAILEEARRSHRESGGIPLEEVRRTLGLDPLPVDS